MQLEFDFMVGDESVMDVVYSDAAAQLARQTIGSAGYDICVNVDIELDTYDDAALVGTGISMSIPEGYVGLLFMRSSLAKRGLYLDNAVGVIDSDYRGELKLALGYAAPVNGSRNYNLKRGDRVAQLVLVPFIAPTINIVESLDETERGSGGFGSTG